MTVRTLMILESNYPDNILICTGQDKETLKWAGFVYLLKDGHIHYLLANTANVFESEEIATSTIKDNIESILDINHEKV